MKKVILLSAAALTAFAGAASALTSATDSARATIERVAPDADLAGLSNAEVVAVLQAIQDETGAASKAAAAKSLIRAYQ